MGGETYEPDNDWTVVSEDFDRQDSCTGWAWGKARDILPGPAMIGDAVTMGACAVASNAVSNRYLPGGMNNVASRGALSLLSGSSCRGLIGNTFTRRRLRADTPRLKARLRLAGLL